MKKIKVLHIPPELGDGENYAYVLPGALDDAIAAWADQAECHDEVTIQVITMDDAEFNSLDGGGES